MTIRELKDALYGVPDYYSVTITDHRDLPLSLQTEDKARIRHHACAFVLPIRIDEEQLLSQIDQAEEVGRRSAFGDILEELENVLRFLPRGEPALDQAMTSFRDWLAEAAEKR